MISTFAKQARGMMARYIIDEGITSVSPLKKFTRAGYVFQKELSTKTQLVYTRLAQ